MRDLIIAVDVGRSAVKVVASFKGKLYNYTFPSIYSSSWGSHADPSSTFANLRTDDSKDYFIDENNHPHLFGHTAETLGNNAISFTESSVFHEFSVYAILYSVLYFLNKFKTKATFDLGINLTFSNAYSKDYYVKQLKKKHKLTYENEVYTFDIDSLFCFQQGYAALFRYLKTGTKEESLISNGIGLVVDIGRYTLDLALVNRYSLVSGVSNALGTFNLISKLQEALSSKIELSFSDIESVFTKPETKFSDIFGHQVIPAKEPCYNSFVQSYIDDLSVSIRGFIGNKRIDYIYFVGGGSILFGDALSRIFAAPRLEQTDVYANASGIVRFLQEII